MFDKYCRQVQKKKNLFFFILKKFNFEILKQQKRSNDYKFFNGNHSTLADSLIKSIANEAIENQDMPSSSGNISLSADDIGFITNGS